jgi:hypothetical protein
MFATEYKSLEFLNEEAGSTDLESVTSKNQYQCHILRLPAELRNAIYAYVLGGHTLDVNLAAGHKFQLRQDINLRRSARTRASNTTGTWN